MKLGIGIKNIILTYLVVVLSGCIISDSSPKYNTEIKCRAYPYEILLLEFSIDDMNRAIDNAIQIREKNKTEEGYTVLKLPNKKTALIPKITPQEMRQECSFLQIPIDDKNKNIHMGNRYYGGRF